MENHFDLRVDPGKLVPGARSVITLLMNHFPGELQPEGVPALPNTLTARIIMK